jgi:hypothetical protein
MSTIVVLVAIAGLIGCQYLWSRGLFLMGKGIIRGFAKEVAKALKKLS